MCSLQDNARCAPTAFSPTSLSDCKTMYLRHSLFLDFRHCKMMDMHWSILWHLRPDFDLIFSVSSAGLAKQRFLRRQIEHSQLLSSRLWDLGSMLHLLFITRIISTLCHLNKFFSCFEINFSPNSVNFRICKWKNFPMLKIKKVMFSETSGKSNICHLCHSTHSGPSKLCKMFNKLSKRFLPSMLLPLTKSLLKYWESQESESAF